MSRNSSEVYSAYVLGEHGTYENPSFNVPGEVLGSANPDESIREALLAHYGRKYFAVYGINPDPDAPDESVQDLDTWALEGGTE